MPQPVASCPAPQLLMAPEFEHDKCVTGHDLRVPPALEPTSAGDSKSMKLLKGLDFA